MRRAAMFLLLTGLAAAPANAAPPPIGEQAAIFQAAGFARQGREWRTGDCAPPEASYAPGSNESLKDLNGDGRPEAVVTEQGGLCYGMTGQSFWLLSKQADGSWRLLTQGIAIPSSCAPGARPVIPTSASAAPASALPWSGGTGASTPFIATSTRAGHADRSVNPESGRALNGKEGGGQGAFLLFAPCSWRTKPIHSGSVDGFRHCSKRERHQDGCESQGR